MNLWKEISLSMLRVRFPALAEWMKNAPDEVITELSELLRIVREHAKESA